MHYGLGENCQLMEKTIKAHAKNRKQLAIDTLAPLHRSLSQQEKSHVLTLYPCLSRTLQPSSQIAFVEQPFP